MKLNINGTAHNVDVPKDMPLLWVLRDRLGLTGTKFGCGVAQCGACTVHVDGQPKRSCVTPVKFLGNSKITTIEGLDSPQAKAIQDAWCAIDVPQCGFCQSGQVMTATNLLTEKPNPTDDDIDGALAGNICRCATYVRIRQAVHDAADKLAG
ncbi:(2Fe-2S)-binding protein [Salinisphaera sp. P385]|uniref:(2Fe-2S)-binding protein n=1 Tax=Spectribacter acetivorans TaxID=3075603 RepID=A0ABU3B883_9GAMM|nr:2Fe-2S iron-sulfur cluster-binding protein [Salinisphaera sp. P385]MDT0617503.1 (2Fe-2S)-binding protein [Salinisphaera sp. P385]